MSEIGPLGCIIKEEYTLASDEAVAAATGVSHLWQDSAAKFRGRWEELKSKGVTSIILWPAYESQSKKRLKPHLQKRGTCVSRGFEMACRMSYNSALKNRVRLGGAIADFPYEIIYGGSRNYPGKGRINGDGSVGAWAAEWLSLYGLPERGKYSIDLSFDDEMLAVSLGNSGRKIPQDVLDAAAKHTWATHRTTDCDHIADALASEFGVARCWDTLFGPRNTNGMSRPSSTGAHCQAIIGVAVGPDHKNIFIEIQSWGENSPSGPSKLKTIDGFIDLPKACYGVHEDDYRTAMRSKWWESHAVAIRPGNEYR